VVAHFSLQPYVDFFSTHYEGEDSLQALVKRAWGLEELARWYSEFLADHQAVLERWRTGPTEEQGREAFVGYVLTLTMWRRLPFLDPGLPADLLPPDWPGHDASRTFLRLARTLGPRAFEHVREVMGLPPGAGQLAKLHGGR
jgi:phenylacetic acid degradation operon negative regulatory protein